MDKKEKNALLFPKNGKHTALLELPLLKRWCKGNPLILKWEFKDLKDEGNLCTPHACTH